MTSQNGSIENLRDYLLYVLRNYQNAKKNQDYSFKANIADKSDALKKIVDDKIIKSIFPQGHYNWHFSGGIGGNWAQVPFLSILNPNICVSKSLTTPSSSTRGIYPVYLFDFTKSEPGVYISYNVAYDQFKKIHRNNHFVAKLVQNLREKHLAKKKEIKYFSDKVKFNMDKITFKDLPEGYEICSLCSKYYTLSQIAENEGFETTIIEDLQKMKNIQVHFEGLIKVAKFRLDMQKKDTRITSILIDLGQNDKNPEDRSSKEDHSSKKTIDKSQENNSSEKKVEVKECSVCALNEPPKKLKQNKKHVQRTVNSVQRATTAKEHGNKGEDIAYSCEVDKFEGAVLLSKHDDTAGYDIRSFDESKQKEKYIEVKTISNKYDPDNPIATFYISINELKVANEQKDDYWIYLVFTEGSKDTVIEINNPFIKTNFYDDILAVCDNMAKQYYIRIKPQDFIVTMNLQEKEGN